MSVKIYKIYSTLGNKVYIGSTTTSLEERFRCHRNSENPGTSHILFDEYGVDNCMIESLEEVKEEERYLRERYWIETTEHSVNERIPGRVGTEKYKVSYHKHRETRLEKARAYKQANKEAVSIKNKEWREENAARFKAMKKAWSSERVNCPSCGKEVCRGALFRHQKTKH